MRLFTSQRRQVAQIIRETGRYVATFNKTDKDEMFGNAYAWLQENISIDKPADAESLIWAYRDLPDYYDYISQGADGEERCFIELEIPDEKAVLLNPENWALIIESGFVYPYNASEEEYDALCDMYENAPKEVIDRNRMAVFNVEGVKFPEVVFWEIKKENVASITDYVCHLH